MSIANGTLILPRMENDDPNGCLECAERVARDIATECAQSLPELGVIDSDQRGAFRHCLAFAEEQFDHPAFNFGAKFDLLQWLYLAVGDDRVNYGVRECQAHVNRQRGRFASACVGIVAATRAGGDEHQSGGADQSSHEVLHGVARLSRRPSIASS